jgi:hypothetical protein
MPSTRARDGYVYLSPVRGLVSEHEKKWRGREKESKAMIIFGQCQAPFNLLQVRYFISSISNLSQEVQYQDMKVTHVKQYSSGALARMFWNVVEINLVS